VACETGAGLTRCVLPGKLILERGAVMSLSKAVAFIKKVEDDLGFKQMISLLRDVSERAFLTELVKLAKKLGFCFTPQEYKKAEAAEIQSLRASECLPEEEPHPL